MESRRNQHHNPPTNCQRFLRYLVPEPYADEIIRDMREEMSARQSARHAFVGELWCWKHALSPATFQLAFLLRRQGRKAPPAWRPVPQKSKHRLRAVLAAFVQDARLALRTLRKQPELTVTAVITLGLGLGANTALFSVVYGVLLNPLPYPDAERVVYMQEKDADGSPQGLSYENFRDWQQENDVFEDMALWVGNSTNFTGGGQPERIRGLFVTASYFTVAGIQPALGRAIRAGEDVPGGTHTTVLSHGFWNRGFGGDPDILGSTITLNNVSHTVVGIMPEGFVPFWDRADAWISLQTASGWPLDREHKSYASIGRLKDGLTLEQAQTDLEAIHTGLAATYPQYNSNGGVWIAPLASLVRDGAKTRLLTVMAAAIMVLAIACVNVANLQLARASGRTREMAVRSALGGSRWRLTSQMLVESMVLAVAGGILGLSLSYWGVELVTSLRPVYREIYDVHLNTSALGFGIGLSVLTGLIFGLGPARQYSRANIGAVLGEGSRGSSAGSRTTKLRGVLVVSQMALAVMLLISAGLLIRSIRQLGSVDTGFDTENLLTLEFRLPPNKYREREQRVAFYDQTLARVAAIPGVVHVASAGSLPFSWNGGFETIFMSGQNPSTSDGLDVQTNAVSPDYFDAMRIPIVTGRKITRSDRLGTAAVGIISRTAAELLWPGQDPVGQIVRIGEDPEPVSIIGVAGDVMLSLTDDIVPHLYVPYAQRPTILASIVVKTESDPIALAPAVQEAIWQVDPDQPVWEIMPIADRIAGSIQSSRFVMVLLGAFAVVALVLAATGIYGVIAYNVKLRSREIGLRMALGAQKPQISGMVLKQGSALAGVGVVIGLAGAAGLTRVLDSILFDVSALDPMTFFSVPILLTIVALAACYVPAYRAAKVDPAKTLHGS